MAAVKYREGKDGDKTVIPFEGVRKYACCDCGLVHKHVYSVEDKHVVERVYRDNRATAVMRNAKAKKGEIIAERKANVYVIMQRIRRKRKRGKLTATYEPY